MCGKRHAQTENMFNFIATLMETNKNAKDNATGRQAFDLISLQPKEKVRVEMLPTFLDERQELVVGQLANTLVRQ